MAVVETDIQEGFRSTEASRLAGITYKQLDNWTRAGIIKPSVEPAKGSGSQRLYSFEDLVCIAAVGRLTLLSPKREVDTKQAKEVVAKIRRERPRTLSFHLPDYDGILYVNSIETKLRKAISS